MDVEQKLREVPAWRREGDEIRRSITAPDFPTAIRIVDEIAVEAEALNHHPDIDIRWRTLHLALTAVHSLTALRRRGGECDLAPPDDESQTVRLLICRHVFLQYVDIPVRHKLLH